MDDHKSSIVECDRSLKVSGESEATMPEQLVRVAPDAPAHVWPGVVAALAVEETRLMIAVRRLNGGTYGNAAFRIIRDALGVTGRRYREITEDTETDTDAPDEEDEECDNAGSCCGYCGECDEHHDVDYRDNVCDMGHCHECDHNCDDF